MADRTMVDYTQKIKPYFEGIAPIEPTTTAASTHAVGDKFYLNGTKVKCTVAIAVGDTIAIGTNVEEADDVESEIQTLTNKVNGLTTNAFANGAVNKLPFDLAAIKAANPNGTWSGNVFVRAGVTFTINDDNSISTSGNSSGAYFNYPAYTFKAGRYKLCGCPSGGSGSSYYVQATSSYIDVGDGSEINLSSDTSLSVQIVAASGTNMNGKVFKPMIGSADMPNIDYAHYVPYAKTNTELTAENEALTNNLADEVETRAKLGAHNVMPYPYYTSTPTTLATSLAVSEPERGVIRFNGTAVGAGVFYCGTDIKLPVGEYEVSKGVNNDNVCVLVEGYNGNTWVKLLVPEDYTISSSTFTLDYSNYDNLRITVRVRNNATLSNVDVKPIIKLASDKDNTWQPPAKTNQELTQDTNAIEPMLNVLGAKNIFDIEKWLTISGLAYTKNGDTYTTSTGGTSYSSPFSFADTDIDIVISGIITNVTSEYARIEVLNANNEVVATIRDGLSSASGKGSKIRLNYSTAGSLSIEKPMIRDATIKNADYAPYAMTNKELTDFATLADLLVSNSSSRIIPENTLPSELTNGVYRFDSGRTSGLWAGYGVIVLTLKNSTPNGVQLAFKIGADSDVSSNYVAYRLSYNNTWSNWAKLSGTNVT